MRVFNPRKLRYAKVFDSVGKLMFQLLRGGDSIELTPVSHLTPQRILVLESHLIGDIVMAIPALRALRDHFRSSEIILLAGSWGKELLKDQKLVDDFIEI